MECKHKKYGAETKPLAFFLIKTQEGLNQIKGFVLRWLFFYYTKTLTIIFFLGVNETQSISCNHVLIQQQELTWTHKTHKLNITTFCIK